ncbi:MFS family permease [Microbacterium phyllosphaerae]|uniref:MFS family permease n=1 Tax=Microbacterium phyllosphaerae TaxID=124798 RepID=A0ABS4WLD5_9MICO|nr:MFS transporter [Microbacterium phyllosphaerae]MBP2376841.1 MFS family permease [Microbacterium phyllosphaerae]
MASDKRHDETASGLDAAQRTTLAGNLAAEAADISTAIEADPRAEVKLPKRELLAVFLAQTTLFMALVVPTAFSLAIKIGAIDPAGRDLSLALAVGVGGTVIIFTNPVLAIMSDRTRSRFGRRRPWFLLGLVLGLLGSAIVGFGTVSAVLIAGWAVAIVGYTLSAGMLLTYLGDRLPEQQRGKVMGVIGAISQIGPILGIALAGSFANDLTMMFVLPAIVAFVGPLWFAVTMKDSQFTGEIPPLQLGQLARGFYFNPRRHSNYGWVIVSKFFIYASLAFTSIYGVYLLQGRLGLDVAEVSSLVALIGLGGVVTAIVGAIGAGWLSDKLHSRKPFLVVSALLLVVSPITVGLSTSVLEYAIAALIGTLAIGIYGSVDQALALDTLPSEENENGRYLAIFGLANAVPQAAGPFAAAGVLALFGGDYSWVYFVAGGFAFLAALAILPISVGRRAQLSTTSIVTAK